MRLLHSWKVPFASALVLTGLPVALIVLSRHADAPAAGKVAAPVVVAAATAPTGQAVPVEISLSDALGRRWLQAQYIGNGRSEIHATFVNAHPAPLRLMVPAGTIFETSDLRHQMVVARGETVELPVGGTRATWLPCAATRLTNVVAQQPYQLCPSTLPILDGLFAQVDKSPELSRETIQTAVLLLTANPPLSAFAKFSVLSDEASTVPSASPYRVNTGEILAAFTLLKDAGYPRRNLLAAQEPQLKIEAMIDPLSHAAALNYYHLDAKQEWAYWRDELQTGDQSTRHYALYGIGRYYPEVALQMLPDWARATQLTTLQRTSAIQAMAETHRPEAISVLQELVSEFGPATELGASARKAIAYLENQRATPVSSSPVEFKLSQATLR